MQYHISRNGQTYGPYTREDLERYVSTGNVLLTDMAKSDAMTEWIPVSDVLAGRSDEPGPQTPAQETPAAFSQPTFNQQPTYNQQPGFQQPSFSQPTYAQPTFGQPAGYGNQPYGNAAYGAGVLANSTYPDPPNLSWGLVLLIDVFTCGLFQLFWNIYMASWLKKVRPSATTPLYCFIAVAVLYVLTAGLAIPSVLNPHDTASTPALALLGVRGLFSLALWVIKLVGRFSFSSELTAQYGIGGPENIGIDVNPVMLFFFGGLYLQSHLSRIFELKAAARMNAMQGR